MVAGHDRCGPPKEPAKSQGCHAECHMDTAALPGVLREDAGSETD
jgi:hypothetical protein